MSAVETGAELPRLDRQLHRLDRQLPGAPAAPPVRIVHLGIGNFHRAHQAWYTWRAPDAADWGIAAFTGRRPDAAEALAPQDGLYTLITRSADGDSFELIGALAEVRAASEHERFLELLAAPATAIVTITVTEAGYLMTSEGTLDDSEAVRADVAALRDDPRSAVQTLPGKLVAGLLARRAAEAGGLTVLSCDNLPHNGEVARIATVELARQVDPEAADWIADRIEFASSMVDRITPATTDADRELVAETSGYRDAAPVPTEPFHEWVVAGRFAAGRPAWDEVGVQLVDDVAPYEQRKLFLLNGTHSLMAYAGSIRGHESIDQAIADPWIRSRVEAFWDEAERHLSIQGPEIAEYRAALLERYRNPRIRHRLTQIAPDGSTKIRVRIVPTTRDERAAGRLPIGCASALAAWLLHLRGYGAPVRDHGGDPFVAAASATDLRAAAMAVLARLDAGLAEDRELIDTVVGQAEELLG